MRELIFRGKRKDNGKWVYGSFVQAPKDYLHQAYISLDNDTLHDERSGYFNDNSMRVLSRFFPVVSKSVGQYTGLHDKNGKEIYEGDIYKVEVNKHFWKYEVKSIGGQFGGVLFGIQLYSNCSTSEESGCYTYEITRENAGGRAYVHSGKNVEIIGNIYEHSNLLKEEGKC